MAWYDTSWQHRVKITTDASKVTATLTSFAVPYDLSGLPASAWSSINADGGDLRVTKADETTELPIEVASIDTGAQTGIIWVEVDSLAAAGQDLYLYYGNPSATGYSDSGTFGAHAVWANGYALASHMEQADALDSTANGNDGAAVGGPAVAAGQIGNGVDLDGSDDYIDFGGDASLNIGGTALTVSMWTTYEDTGTWWTGVTKNAHEGSHAAPFFNYLLGARDNDTARFRIALDDGTFADVDGDALVSGTRYHLTGTYDGASSRVYVDGSLSATQAGAGSIRQSASSLHVGAHATGGENAQGLIDEVRVSNVTRSDDWIATEYNIQLDPAAFWTTSAEEDKPTTGTTGTSDTTNAGQALAAAGSLTVTATSATSNAAQTSTFAGTSTVTATATASNTGQELSATESAQPTIDATVSLSNAAQTAAGEGAPTVSATTALQNAAQTTSAAASLTVTATTALTADGQSLAASGTLTVTAAGALIGGQQTYRALVVEPPALATLDMTTEDALSLSVTSEAILTLTMASNDVQTLDLISSD